MPIVQKKELKRTFERLPWFKPVCDPMLNESGVLQTPPHPPFDVNTRVRVEIVEGSYRKLPPQKRKKPDGTEYMVENEIIDIMYEGKRYAFGYLNKTNFNILVDSKGTNTDEWKGNLDLYVIETRSGSQNKIVKSFRIIPPEISAMQKRTK